MSTIQLFGNILNIETLNAASPESEIREMLEKSPIAIPDEYTEIIRQGSEFEINIKGSKYFRIWGASGCLEMNDAYRIQKYMPKSWAIGDDEECNVIVYSEDDVRIQLYAVSLSNLGDDEKTFIAPSLFDFLVKGFGVNTFLEV